MNEKARGREMMLRAVMELACELGVSAVLMLIDENGNAVASGAVGDPMRMSRALREFADRIDMDVAHMAPLQ